MKTVQTLLGAAIAFFCLSLTNEASAQRECRHQNFEKSWVNNLTGKCAYTLEELKGQGMTLTGNVRSGEVFHPARINFRCTGLSVRGTICGVVSVIFTDGAVIDPNHEVLYYGLHVMGRDPRSDPYYYIENPYEPNKWVNMKIRAREGKVMP